MNSQLSEQFSQIQDNIKNYIIEYNKEKWNFFTNATTENRKRYYRSVMEFITYLTDDSDLSGFIQQSKSMKIKASEEPVVERIKSIRHIYEKNELTELMVNTLIDAEMIIINDRITYNSKDSTSSHIADLAEHETSLSDIIKLQKLFFSRADTMKTHIVNVVKTRNEYFASKGYADFYDYFMKSNGYTETKIKAAIEKVDKMTAEKYKKIKKDLDSTLEKKLKCHSTRIPAYIYGDPFFRFYPVHIDQNVNQMFKGKDIAYTGFKYYDMLGVNLNEIFEVSDLYIRPGKYQGNLVVDIDREGDIRFSVNSKSNFRGIYNLLRTLGKVVFMSNYCSDKPFLTKSYPERGIVEGFGLYMTEYAFKAGYISKIIAQYEDEDEQILININDYMELNRIINIRFYLALAEFEILLNRGKGDPAKSWEQCVKKYQFIDTSTAIDRSGWAMIDSIATDPFSSIYEVEAFINAQAIEKSLSQKQISGRGVLKHLLQNYVCGR